MFLHLGNNYLVNTKDVIGIFDIENTSVSANTKEFLNVVCLDKDFTETVYISQMSCATLLKRSKRMPE